MNRPKSKTKMRITREWSEKHPIRRHEKHAGDIGHASAPTHPDRPLRGMSAAKFLRVGFLPVARRYLAVVRAAKDEILRHAKYHHDQRDQGKA